MKKLFLFLIGLFLFISVNISAQSGNNYQLSTHILDISAGKPAADVEISLYKLNNINQNFELITTSKTDENGRIADFLPLNKVNNGVYKLKFETQDYFKKQNIPSIYPYIEVVFSIEGNSHYHIPITLSANGYSTYRGN